MIEIRMGDNVLKVRATALTLLFYKQEFKKDLIGDFMKFDVLQKDPTQWDSVMILQMVWAMTKTEALASNLGASFPGFQSWVSKLQRIDFAGEGITNIMSILVEAFFRS